MRYWVESETGVLRIRFGLQPNSEIPEKQNLHPRNPHRGQYDFKQLGESNPALKPFVSRNQYDEKSMDFSNPAAVKELNRALLKSFYNNLVVMPSCFNKY